MSIDDITSSTEDIFFINISAEGRHEKGVWKQAAQNTLNWRFLE